jgi:dTDP-4-amino-4,6-dideoxygalactose transaminase
VVISAAASAAGLVMIPFNKPYMTGSELDNIAIAHSGSQLSGDGPFTRRCQDWLKQQAGSSEALLTHSCTAALEMAAILADLQPGDEVVMPSFTFVSTANAFALRGAVPVFVDIRPDTLNLDETALEAAITHRTRAIVPVHYAGVACAMDRILALAAEQKVLVIEDAAQALMARYRGQPLGSLGDLGAYSFHETKNVVAGEGGALMINQPQSVARAEIIREKGTNRSGFLRGEIQKYTWVDIGSSFLPGEITAAFLMAQLQEAQEITARRIAIWQRYHDAFAALEQRELLRRPVVPPECEHNGHMYYLLLRNLTERDRFIERMRSAGVSCVFHYVPLHNSPKGRALGRSSGNLHVTEDVSDRLVRLPLWLGLEADQDRVIEAVYQVLGS